MKRIIIGITTYNRKDLVMKCAHALFDTDQLDTCDIVVWDDGSSEYDHDFLVEIFRGCRVIGSTSNMGSDWNLHRMYKDFLGMDADYLLNLDSDLIMNPDCISLAHRLIGKTDGILSLYNSFKHPSIAAIRIDGEDILVKNRVGSAGVVFGKEILEDIVENVPPSRSYDWDWSRYLSGTGRRIMVCKQSHVQHIGAAGYNTNGFGDMDYGLHFFPKTAFTTRCVSEVAENLFVECASMRSNQDRIFHFVPKTSATGRVITMAMCLKRNLFRKEST